MSTNVTFNGTSYTVPAIGDASWGTNVSNYLIAIASGCLQKSGGTFTLTAEVDFGATFGLKSAYLKSRTTNVASAGQVRLANADTIGWRNAANNADLGLTVNASNVLTFNSNPIVTLALGAGNTALTMNSGGTAFAWTTIVNAQIDSAAAIAYSKLNLATSVVNADISTSAAIAYSKLNLSGSIATADLASGLLLPATKGGTGVANNVANTLTFSGNFGLTATLTATTAVTLPTAGTLATLAGTESPTNKTFDSTSTMTGVKIASFTPDGTHTLTAPTVTDTLVAKTTTDILTNKTLTSPTINTPTISAGTLAALTGLAIRDTSAAFDVTIAATSSTTLTAGRTLTLDMGNAARTLKMLPLANFSGLADGSANQVLTTLGTNLGYAWAAGLTTALNSANILVGNGSNIATSVAVSGDLTLANTGAFTIANAAVTGAKIANTTITDANVSASAAIAGSKLQAISGSNAGVLTTGADTIAGDKTWTGQDIHSVSISTGTGVYARRIFGQAWNSTSFNTFCAITPGNTASTGYVKITYGGNHAGSGTYAGYQTAFFSSVSNVVTVTQDQAVVNTGAQVNRGANFKIIASGASVGIQISSSDTNSMNAGIIVEIWLDPRAGGSFTW